MATTSNPKPSGEDLIDMIERMDSNEVRHVYYRALRVMQSRMHTEQRPYKDE